MKNMGNFLAVVAMVLAAFLAFAWMTFFPAVGLLYMVGYLQ